MRAIIEAVNPLTRLARALYLRANNLRTFEAVSSISELNKSMANSNQSKCDAGSFGWHGCFCFILLLLATSVQASAQNYFRIIGTVRDDQGQSVPSIRVTLENENSTTLGTVFADSSGRFQFGRLRSGNYQISVETVGFPFEKRTVRVELESIPRTTGTSLTEEPTLVDIVLKRKVNASGSAPAVVFAQVIPPAAREEYNRGSTLIKKDQDAGAESLKKAIELFPEYFDALDLLGTEYVKNGKFDIAVPLLLKAVEINDKASSSMYGLGVAYLNTNHFEEALNWLQRAAEGDPSNPNVFMMQGLAFGRIGRLVESETALKKAYKLGGAMAADVHLYLAGIYNKLERFGEAWRELELYLKEAKGVKDKTKINEMISNLKEKEKAKH
jgi:Flp pilus assembly protein TadD